MYNYRRALNFFEDGDLPYETTFARTRARWLLAEVKTQMPRLALLVSTSSIWECALECSARRHASSVLEPASRRLMAPLTYRPPAAPAASNRRRKFESLVFLAMSGAQFEAATITSRRVRPLSDRIRPPLAVKRASCLFSNRHARA